VLVTVGKLASLIENLYAGKKAKEEVCALLTKRTRESVIVSVGGIPVRVRPLTAAVLDYFLSSGFDARVISSTLIWLPEKNLYIVVGDVYIPRGVAGQRLLKWKLGGCEALGIISRGKTGWYRKLLKLDAQGVVTCERCGKFIAQRRDVCPQCGAPTRGDREAR